MKRLLALLLIACMLLAGCAQNVPPASSDTLPSATQSAPETSPSSSAAVSEIQAPNSQPQKSPSTASNPAREETPPSIPAVEQEKPQTVCVYVTITCRKAVEARNENIAKLYGDGTILGRTKIELPAGSTCYDVIKTACENNKILFYASKSYVSAIGGVKEKDCGGASGWKYSVNGQFIMKPCGGYTLSDGDEILWGYSVDGMRI